MAKWIFVAMMVALVFGPFEAFGQGLPQGIAAPPYGSAWTATQLRSGFNGRFNQEHMLSRPTMPQVGAHSRWSDAVREQA